MFDHVLHVGRYIVPGRRFRCAEKVRCWGGTARMTKMRGSGWCHEISENSRQLANDGELFTHDVFGRLSGANSYVTLMYPLKRIKTLRVAHPKGSPEANLRGLMSPKKNNCFPDVSIEN